MNPEHADAVGMLNKLTRTGWRSDAIQPFKGYKIMKGKQTEITKKLPSLGIYTSRSSFKPGSAESG
jgi:hypothetical protein